MFEIQRIIFEFPTLIFEFQIIKLEMQRKKFEFQRVIFEFQRFIFEQRATLLLHTWIYFCRSGGMVNFTLPFMTNVTISISTSQIFRSWVAIFPPRPPMASLFRSLYGMLGLAPQTDVLSWRRRDFQISFSNRDTSRNAWNRHWGSFMVDTGILSNNMKFPSHKC